MLLKLPHGFQSMALITFFPSLQHLHFSVEFADDACPLTTMLVRTTHSRRHSPLLQLGKDHLYAVLLLLAQHSASSR